MAVGSVVVLAGDGGVGKSTLAQHLAARMTRGQGPDGGPQSDPRHVVILSAEEDPAAVIRPRMRLMGADLARVTILDPETAGLTLPAGMSALAERALANDAGVVVVDTGPAFLDRGLKSNTEEDIRRQLRPLGGLAGELRAVVLVLAHLNKDTSRSAAGRIMGGAAWRNAPRQVLMVGAPPGQDPRETGDRIIAVEKNNLGVYPAALAFRLLPSPSDPSGRWSRWARRYPASRPTNWSASPQAPKSSPNATRPPTSSGRSWPRKNDRWRRSGGRRRRPGSDESTVKKAKPVAGAVSRRVGGPGSEGHWMWSIPKGDALASLSAGDPRVPLSENPHGESNSAGEPPLRETVSGGVSLSAPMGSADSSPALSEDEVRRALEGL